ANGRLLPCIGIDAAQAVLAANEQEVIDLPIVEIPPRFWSLKGIEFEASEARNDESHYCHIHFRTDEVLAVFPGDNREQVIAVKKIGSSYLLNESAAKIRPGSRRSRGRPSYPWEAFHLEIASLIQGRDLPVKKEAGIQYFQDWFQRALGIRPSRAAIGEKLKP